MVDPIKGKTEKVPACPRGFYWCAKSKECKPDRGGVEDKLMVKAERYFFKEDTCPDGSVWCPMKKKCIPEKEMKSMGHGKGKGFGKGKGPVGVPKKEDITMDKIDTLVDEVFDGGFHQFGKVRKAETQIDKILDLMVSECGGPPMNEERFEASEYDDDAPAKEDDSRKLANDINTVPNQDTATLLKSVHDELSEAQVWKTIAEMRINENYKKYFKLMLKKHGYSSPADIPADKKKAFFNSVDKGWKGMKEQMIRRSDPSSRGGFGSIRGTSTRGGFGSVSGTRQSGGFGSIRGRREEDEVDDKVDTKDADAEKNVKDADDVEKEQIIKRADPSKRGGFGSIKGTSTRGGFGRIAGTRQSGGFGSIRGRNEQDEVKDDELEDANDEVADEYEA